MIAQFPAQTRTLRACSASTDGDSFPDDDSDVGDDPELEPAEAPSLVSAPKPKALEVAFNDPEKKGDRALEKGLEELIALASPGSSIHIALYGFTRSSPAKALIKAHKERNVDVQLVLRCSARRCPRARSRCGRRLAIVPEPHRSSAQGSQQQRDRAR